MLTPMPISNPIFTEIGDHSGIGQDEIPELPLSRRTSSRPETIKFLTQDETRRLFFVIRRRRDRALFLIAYRHGLRPREPGLLQTSDFDLKNLRAMFHRLKGSLSGQHPLQPDEVKALKSYLRSRKTNSPVLFASRRGRPPFHDGGAGRC